MPLQLRIIGGACKGMKLNSPPVGITRPLRGIVKKSLFDILADRIDGAACLDLFSGSGSIGLEALSRGAGCCVFIESHREVQRVLQKNVDKICHGVDNDTVKVRIIKADVEAVLEGGAIPEAPFDFVFLDPPYAARESAMHCLELLAGIPGWVHPESIVIYQFKGDLNIEDKRWRTIDSRKFGGGRLVFLSAAVIE